MKQKAKYVVKRGFALLLATILTTINFLTYLPIPAYAKNIPEWDGQIHNSGFFDSTYMCIDSVHILGKNGGIYAVGDTYKAYEPSDGLSSDQIATIWWAVISNYASAGDSAAIKVMDSARTIVSNVVNVSTEDVKGILHSSAIAGKYPWINQAKSKATEIFTAAGYMGGSGSSTVGGGGKSVPSAILPYSSSGNPLQLAGDDKSITLTSDFLSTVKVEYSSSAAGPFSTTPISGWSHSISGDTITFFNPDSNPAAVYVQFNVAGTAYASAGGSYSSPEALYNETMILWKCSECTQIHNAFHVTRMRGGDPPTCCFAGNRPRCYPHARG